MAYSVCVSAPKYIEIRRDQPTFGIVDVEELIPLHHVARAIWSMTARFDFTVFEQDIRTRTHEPGRTCWSPRLLTSVWIYAYSQGVSSARAVERMMSYEPGLRWLCADKQVNHHTLSDFRVSHKARLDELMAQLLAVLDREQMIDLRVIMHDGTKLRAVASKHSFHRRRTVKGLLAMAQRTVAELNRRAAQETSEPDDARKRAAERRAAEEKLKRMEASLGMLEQQDRSAKGEQARVSVSEPEARKMRTNDGGWAPSYNVQISADAKHKIVVGVDVSAAPADTLQLEPGLRTVEQFCKRKPDCVVADAGYTSRENIEALADKQISFIAPWRPNERRFAGAAVVHGVDPGFAPPAFGYDAEADRMQCPAGNPLIRIKDRRVHGQTYAVYQAEANDCAGCADQQRCCGKQTGPRRVRRAQESKNMQAYLKRMQEPETQRLYKTRSEIGEFPQLWIKGLWKLRSFCVRGLHNAAKEALWLVMAYNIQQWARLKWLPKLAAQC